MIRLLRIAIVFTTVILAAEAAALDPTADFRELMKQCVAELRSGKLDVDNAAKAFHYDLEEVMHVMKPFGKNIDAKRTIWRTGAERRIQTMAREGIAKADLDEPDNLRELGFLVQTVGLITEKLPNDKAKMELKQWNEYTHVLVKEGKKLVASVANSQSKEIHLAVVAINSACNGCHTRFR